MDNKKYNGWASYETWHVQLHIFSDMEKEEFAELFPKQNIDARDDLADYIRERYTFEGSNMLLDSVLEIFISNVDIYELLKNNSEE